MKIQNVEYQAIKCQYIINHSFFYTVFNEKSIFFYHNVYFQMLIC